MAFVAVPQAHADTTDKINIVYIVTSDGSASTPTQTTQYKYVKQVIGTDGCMSVNLDKTGEVAKVTYSDSAGSSATVNEISPQSGTIPTNGYTNNNGLVKISSNFEGKYIAELETKWETAPQFIQVEAHPCFTQKDLRVTLDKYGIKLMSWYPLGHGDKSLIQEPVFAELGKKYGKTPAQVILRWHTQMGFVVIPGSKNVDHIKDNLNIMDFELTADEMAEIAKLDKGERYYHRTEEQLVQFAAWKPEFEKA